MRKGKQRHLKGKAKAAKKQKAKRNAKRNPCLKTKKDILDYLKTARFDIQNATASFFAISWVYDAYVKSSKVHGVDYSPLFYYSTKMKDLSGGVDFHQLIPDQMLREVSDRIYAASLRNSTFLSKIIKSHMMLEQGADRLWKEYTSKKSLSTKELVAFFLKLLYISERWWYYASIGEYKGKTIDDHLIPLFEKKHNLSKTKAAEIVIVLSRPKDEAIFTSERKDFFTLCLAILSKKSLRQAVFSLDARTISKDKAFMRLFSRYVRNYFFNKTTFYNCQKITLNLLLCEIRNEIRDRSPEDIKLNIRKIVDERKILDLKKKRILSWIKLSPEDRKNLEIARLLMNWQDYRKRGMMKQMHYLFSMLEEIAKKLNITYADISSLTPSELTEILAGRKKIDKNIISLRKKQCFSVFQKNCSPSFFYSENAAQLFEVAKGRHFEHKVVGGFVASKRKESKVQGVVRVVKDPLKDEFRLGEILVTSMTRIEFVPLLKKAKAIITDEGGIACHAAIVSRELGVPCIIGTRVGTRLLKNGDFVELDMLNGSVKIIGS